LCCGQSGTEANCILVFRIFPFIIISQISQNRISFVYDRLCVILQLTEFLKTRQSMYG